MKRSSGHRALLPPLRAFFSVIISIHATAAFSTVPALSRSPRLPFTTSSSTRRSGSFGLQMQFPNLNLNFGGAEKSTATKREECKRKLLTLISSSKQGKQQTPEEKDAIFLAMRELEGLNICDAPVESELISGKWSLLYTGAADEDIITRREKEGWWEAWLLNFQAQAMCQANGDAHIEQETEELPLGRSITTFANSFVQNKGNFQDIDAGSNYVENRATFTVGGLPLELKIEGSCSKVEEEDLRLTRLDVFFERVLLRVGKLQVLAVPLTWPNLNEGRGPRGWLDTTYLDESMRLGRGDKGSFFVTVRRPE